MGARILVARARDRHVLGHDPLSFSLELLRQHLLELPALDADEPQDRGDGGRVVVQLALRQLGHRQRAELHALRGAGRLDLAAVVEDGRAGTHQPHVPVDGVLVEGDQHVELVAHAADGRFAGPYRQESVAAADDRLVGVVRVDVEPAAHEEPGQHRARRRDPLAGRPADSHCKVDVPHVSLSIDNRGLTSGRPPKKYGRPGSERC